MSMAMAIGGVCCSGGAAAWHHGGGSRSKLSIKKQKQKQQEEEVGKESSEKAAAAAKKVTMRSRLSQLCKEGRPDAALRLFESSIHRNNNNSFVVVLWNTIIIGFICNGMPREALLLYARIINNSSTSIVKSDLYTYSAVLKACAQTQQLQLGKIIHCRILRSYHRHRGIAVANNSLLNMYSSCSPPEIDLVTKLFDTMTHRNVVAWNTLIAWYVKTNRFTNALNHFLLMIQATSIKPTVVTFLHLFPAAAALAHPRYCFLLYGMLLKLGSHYSNHLFLISSAISMFSHLSDIHSAATVFNLSLSLRPTTTIQVWNTMIAAYLHNNLFHQALHLFLRLHHILLPPPDHVTFLSSLTAVSQLQSLDFGKQLHAYILKHNNHHHLNISNALISMYSRCNSIDLAFRVFHNMDELDLVSWNTMVSAFVQNGFHDEGLMLVYEMMKQRILIDSITATALLSAASNLRNSQLGKQTHAYLFRHGITFQGMDTYLIHMYSNSGFIHTAQRIFQNTNSSSRDHATWNAMIAGYTHNGETQQPFTLLRQMLLSKLVPNSVTLSSILPACIPSGGISLGKQIHAFAIRHSFHDNVFVATALMDMYSKCASIDYAERMFNRIPEKNSVTYTTMILGYGQHGLGERALAMFQAMRESAGMNPDAVTLVAILSACSYSGLVDQGLQIFESMESLYGISPTAEHYSCVVDMLGRAGRVVEAYEFVKNLGDKGNTCGVWGSLLGACRIHGKLEMGKTIADRLFELEKEVDVTGYHVLLSNIYADRQMWDCADGVRDDIKEKGLKKQIGCSWIEIGSIVNCFTSRDQAHPQCNAVYAKLEELYMQMKAAGYKPKVGCESLTPQVID